MAATSKIMKQVWMKINLSLVSLALGVTFFPYSKLSMILFLLSHI